MVDLPSQSRKLIINGYNVQDESNYEFDINQDSRHPLLPVTILWEPNVKTDENGYAKVSFKTSDNPNNLKVHIEGLTAKGYHFMVEKIISVKDDDF